MDEQNNMNMNVGTEEGTSGSSGPIIAAIVILAIVILGGLYFWNQRASEDLLTNEAVENINMQSESDETSLIEADLEATEIESLGEELNAS